MQIILNHQEIQNKINRISHQIIENCFEENNIFIAGIEGNGIILANLINHVITTNSNVKTKLVTIKIDKDKPWTSTAELDIDKNELSNGYLFLVDDVINSGKTIQYALNGLLDFPTKAIKTVTLVDRKHRRFPVKGNFVGLTLSTTLKEHVKVNLEENNYSAYLT